MQNQSTILFTAALGMQKQAFRAKYYYLRN
jgi:hypothetical protein